MSDRGPGSGSVVPNEARDSDEENTVPRRNIRNVLPPSVKCIFAANPHISDWLPRLNCHHDFLSHKRTAEKRKALQERKDSKRQCLEEKKQSQESSYPPDCFVVCDAEATCVADVKGSVVLPCSSESVCVEGHVLQMEDDGKHVLLVLYTVSEPCRRYFPSLCPVGCLPKAVASRWKNKLSTKKRATEWSHFEFESYQVQRNHGAVHLITTGPFSNRTCDDAMAQSLRSGFVVARRDLKSRQKYAWCLPGPV